MNNEDLRSTVLEYLKSHHIMTLATTLDDRPWATTVYYASYGFNLYFLSNPLTSRHGQNLATNHRVSASITEDYPLEKLDDWRKINGVQLEGTANLVTTEPEIKLAVETYVARYPFTAAYLIGITTFPRVTSFLEKASRNLQFIPNLRASLENRFYQITPERVWFIDNETSFERRQEVNL